ncbi:MAG TPA: Nramp family divalent metal transporter [Candidatus Polarisedimenticolaceae bacterium]|nr:Nramp family divalent metal transporter [Candidatus Polarisedimenticolaceae bacterium]
MLRRALTGAGARLAAIIAVFGPGMITSNVDNDAGGIYTYSLCGARYGYRLLWILLPVTLALIVVQEMCARMGTVTGKGLADLIREEFGLRITFLLMMAVLFTNLGNAAADFAGLASALEVVGVSRYVAVPLGAFFIWYLIVFGTYKTAEKVFLVACLVYFAYPISAVLAKPDWSEAIRGTITPSIPWDLGGVSMVVGIIGTTIAPWMQFYLQSSIVEKESRISDYKGVRLDVVLGSIVAVVVAFFIVVACAATLHRAGIFQIASGAEAAEALAPLAGAAAKLLFAFGLAVASLFAACILPLSTAYSVCEGLGLEAGVNRRFKEAPEFYWLYTGIIAASAGMILIPRVPLLPIILISQILNGLLLPVVLVFMALLIRRRSLMGEFVNGPVQDVVTWTTTAALVALAIAMAVTSALPGAAPGY